MASRAHPAESTDVGLGPVEPSSESCQAGSNLRCAAANPRACPCNLIHCFLGGGVVVVVVVVVSRQPPVWTTDVMRSSNNDSDAGIR